LFLAACQAPAPRPEPPAPADSSTADFVSPATEAELRGENPERLLEGDPPRNVNSAVRPGRGLASRRVPRGLSASGDPGAFGAESRPRTLTEFTAARAARPDLLRFHLLNIGAGSCHLIECPASTDVIVYDCGQMAPGADDMTAEQVRSHVRAVVGSDQPVVVLSHADADHVNLIANVMSDVTPQSIWLGGKLGDYRGSVAQWLDANADRPIHFGWRAGWSENGEPVPELRCGSADVFMLTVNNGSSTNANSLMLLVEHEAFSLVLSGDAEGVTERSALRNFPVKLSGVTVAVASHHGARTHQSNAQQWTEHLQAQSVIYSAGTSHGHPSEEATTRYQPPLDATAEHEMWWAPERPNFREFDSRRTEYATELNGAIVIETDGTEYSIECSRDSTC
jgi:beta-lactamase superfamily II metal-dependent hydrolase